MFRKFTLLWILPVAALAYGFASSGNQTLPSQAPAADVLATVNDIPITQADLQYEAAGAGAHKQGGTAVNQQALLEDIIQQELIYQRAVDLGLDADPAYQADLQKLQVQVNAFKRKRLAQVYMQQEINRRAEVNDAQAREYYEKNLARLTTEVKVWQILKRSEQQIEKNLAALQGGEAFDAVAAQDFPDLPADAKPWDLGYLRWQQIPDAWRDVLDKLKPGERSDIIHGPNHRFWIIKLVDKRKNPAISYEDSKPSIVKILQAENIQRLRDDVSRDIRKKARITCTISRSGLKDDSVTTGACLTDISEY